MADKSFKHPYLPDADGARKRSRDELDGTWSDTIRGRLEGWDPVGGAWIKVAVDSTGALTTAGSGPSGPVTIASGSDATEGAIAAAPIGQTSKEAVIAHEGIGDGTTTLVGRNLTTLNTSATAGYVVTLDSNY